MVVLGSIGILIGIIDPLEGALLIFPGSGMIALGAYLAQTPRRRLVYCAFLLSGSSIAAALGMSYLWHGIPDRWTLVLLPYPIGWMMDVVGVAFTLDGLFEGRWIRVVSAIWVLAAVWLLIRLLRILVFIKTLTPWGAAALIALGCICILGVYLSDSSESWTKITYE